MLALPPFLSVYLCTHVCSTLEGRRVFNHLKVELETVVNSLTWVLGTKFRSSGGQPSLSPAQPLLQPILLFKQLLGLPSTHTAAHNHW